MGRQNALELATRGAHLVLNYSHSAEPAQAVIREIEALGSKAIAIKADVSKPAETAKMFEDAVRHYGRLDIVVSNSGVESFGHVSEITEEEFDRVFAVNTRGQLFVAQQAYKHLSVGGRLVMLSSISASAKGVKNHALYSGSKNAVEAFARCLAVGESSSDLLIVSIYYIFQMEDWLPSPDFGPKRITINAIAPGGIKTDMWVEAARKYIPGGDAMTDEEVDKVSSFSLALFPFRVDIH